jgi:hypothetical protein
VESTLYMFVLRISLDPHIISTASLRTVFPVKPWTITLVFELMLKFLMVSSYEARATDEVANERWPTTHGERKRERLGERVSSEGGSLLTNSCCVLTSDGLSGSFSERLLEHG